MSLVTLTLAFLPVAALFLVAARLAGGALSRQAVIVVLAEAVVLTLFGALWFGSLGHGGWWLVFLLVGCLVTAAERGLRFAILRSAFVTDLGKFALGVARYVGAGALLAWRLG